MAIIDTPVSGMAGHSTPMHLVDAGAGPTVMVPDGVALAGAEFSRAGSDLVVQASDGSQAVLRDFFAAEPAPQLLFDGGEKRISGELASHLAGPEAPGQYAQAGAVATSEPIGTVESLGGTVTATRADGTVVTLDVGDPVYQGDILQSEADSGVGVVLADNTTFSMGPEGRMVLDEMIYDPGSQEGSLAISVLEGVFTFVSGQVAKNDPDAMVVETPVATIGIRGTQIGLDLPPNGPMNAYMLTEADGFTGEAIFTGNGWVAVLNLGLQGVTVTSLNNAPPPPFIASLEDVLSRLAGAFGFLPPNGSANTYGVEPQGRTAADDLGDDFDTAAGGDDNASGDVPPPPATLPPTQTFGFNPINSGIPPASTAVTAGTDDGDSAGEDDDPPEPDPLEEIEEEVPVEGISLTGTEGDDNLFGTEGNDTLTGLGGNDVIQGGGGDDLIDGGEGIDTADMQFNYRDFDISFGEGEGFITDTVFEVNQGSDTLINIEFLQFADGIFDVGAGSFSGSGVLIGSGRDDLIFGSEGDDTISGMGGDDTINGGGGDDVIDGGAGNDILDGGSGAHDIADYHQATSTVEINLAEGFAEGGSDVGTDQLSNFEFAYGGSGGDIITGNSLSNSLYGHGGDDQIFGGNGDDSLYGHEGSDTLDGGEGSDFIVGGTGDDHLYGGGFGGGEQPDFFQFSGGDGSDTIFDFQSGADELLFLGYAAEDLQFIPGNGETFDKIIASNASGTVEVTLEGYSDGPEGYAVSTATGGVSVVHTGFDA